MKEIIQRFFKLLRIWPLLIILKLRIMRKDNEALLWLEDVKASDREGTLAILTHRPYYIELLYHRLHLPFGSIVRFLFGSYPLFLPGYTIVGGGVFLEHPLCSRLNAVSIGSGFHCYHNVTFGDNGRGELPTIGNNVICGAGSCVIGAIKVGDNVKIGANAVVTKDVPSNCTVVGNPALIVKQDGKKVNTKL